jgi:hypothetical protein
VLGCVLLVLSILPWAIAPFAALVGLPTGQLASVIAALLIGAEIIGAAAIAVLGREAYARITRHLRRPRNTTRDAPHFRTSDALEKETPNE